MSKALGQSSFSEGIECVAAGDASHAMGRDTVANGKHSISIGEGSRATGDSSVCLSSLLICEFTNNNVDKNTVVVHGLSNKGVNFKYTDLVGRYVYNRDKSRRTKVKSVASIGDEVFEVTLDENIFNGEGKGDMYISLGTSIGESSVAILGMSVGKYSISHGEGSVAIGNGARSYGKNCLSIGDYSCSEGRGGSSIARRGIIYVSVKYVNMDNNEILVDVGLRRGSVFFVDGEYYCVVDAVAPEYKQIKLDKPIKFKEGNNIFEISYENISFGKYSSARGVRCISVGEISRAEGSSCISLGEGSHAEGSSTISVGKSSHAEGYGCSSDGVHSHAEGRTSLSKGQASHSEGWGSISEGNYSHAEGNETNSKGESSHSEGTETEAEGQSSHAEGLGSSAIGNFSHSEGQRCKSIGLDSHAEGWKTVAEGEYSHAEGLYTFTHGMGSHAEGIGQQNIYLKGAANSNNYEICDGMFSTMDFRELSHRFVIGSIVAFYDEHIKAEITDTYESNGKTHIVLDKTLDAENPIDDTGKKCNKRIYSSANGNYSHAEGGGCNTVEETAHAEGDNCTAIGANSHAEGYFTAAVAKGSHTEGERTIATGYISHAEGELTNSEGICSHAEGSQTLANGNYSHAEGKCTIALGLASHAEGESANFSEWQPFDVFKAERYNYTTHVIETAFTKSLQVNDVIKDKNGLYDQIIGIEKSEISHPGGARLIKIRFRSGKFAEGRHEARLEFGAFGYASHIQGGQCTSLGDYSHAGGYGSKAKGNYSFSHGCGTISDIENEFSIGRYNKEKDTTAVENETTSFVIGNGLSKDRRQNSLRVTDGGDIHIAGKLVNGGADYAEMFEWKDLNMDDEDRIGFMVQLDGDKIVKARSLEATIGVISANASIVGDNSEYWHGQYETDKWGRIVYKTQKVVNEKNEEVEVFAPMESSNYMAGREFIRRDMRREWDAVGLMGKLLVRQDGTLKVGGRCEPDGNGVATKSKTGFYVMKVISNSQALILVK